MFVILQPQMRQKTAWKWCPGGGIGRRVGLKNQWGYTRAGSIPAPGTRKGILVKTEIPFFFILFLSEGYF